MPEPLEAVTAEIGVPDGMLDVLVLQIELNASGVLPVVGKFMD